MNATVLHRVTVWFVLALCGCLAPALEASAQRGPIRPTGPVILRDRLGLQVTIAAGKKFVVGSNRVGPPVSVSVAPGYRATFCESAAVSAKCRRLVGWDGPAPVSFQPPYSARGTVVTVEKALFGYADLHAHPATHLAWGARSGPGPLWGKPGMGLVGAQVGNDLPQCVSDTHSGPTNPIVTAARWGLLQERGKGSHGSFGAPLFSDWPAAHDILHQQMHVTMLRRAYDGGLRLMVASATDNQMLDIMWNPEFSLSQGRFALREDADYKSAVEQFEFTKKFVNANKSWLAIAKTPSEARKAIESNKLVLVFGLEMDGLSVEEIVKLKKDYGVALVTPVHLVNNSFGGAAAYETFFNVANYIMNGSLFGVVNDPSVQFRFPGTPNLYTSYPIVGAMLGPIADRIVEYGSTPQGHGHRNRLGIRDEYGLRRLMKTGVLIDVAHMSSQSTDDTLAIALRPGGPRVPLVYSHGGLRGTQLWGEVQSERGMTLDQLRGLSESGGIFGLGTGEDESVAPPPPMGQWLDRYLEVEQVGNGAIALGTDLNGMAPQIPDTAPSERLAYPSEAIRSADWRSVARTGALGEFMLGAKVYNFNRDGIAHIGMLPDFLSAVRNQAEFRDNGRQDPLGVRRFTRRLDQVFHSAHDFIASWEQAVRAAPNVDVSLPAVTPTSLRLTLETGTDNLKCGNVVVTVLAGSRTIGVHAIASGQGAHSTYRADVALIGGTSLPAISKVKFQYANRKCDDFDTGDRWNIKTLQVTYDVMAAGTRHLGVLIHKRGAPAKKLDRGKTWTVSVER